MAKALLTWPLTHQLTSLGLRAYRTFVFDSVLGEHDPAFVKFLKSGQPAIFAVWHQDFVLTLGYISRFSRALGRTYALASTSRDGGLAATAAMAMGYREPIRGSSARGGNRALLALTRLLLDDDDASLAIVVDGPRPPARQLKPGLIHLASRTQRPVWLVRTSQAPPCMLRRSWAKFHIPVPFRHTVCSADGPIQVPRTLSRDGVERERLEIEGRLNRLADLADARASVLAAQAR